jgi:hypothetical protein
MLRLALDGIESARLILIPGKRLACRRHGKSVRPNDLATSIREI